MLGVAGAMQQLVLASGSDDDMGSLLGLLHSAPATELKVTKGCGVWLCCCIYLFFLQYNKEQGQNRLI